MAPFPIVDRELRVASRGKNIYRVRFFAALAMLGAAGVIMVFHGGPGRGVARAMMEFSGALALGFCVFSGVLLTADSLAEERQDGTLGLLFLTDLKASDIVFGKMTAHSVSAFFGLLATIPILGLPLLMGGVSGWEFGRIVLTCAAALFFSLGIGLCVAATSRDPRRSLMRGLAWVVLFSGVLPGLWWLLHLITDRPAFDFLLFASPLYGYTTAFDAGFQSSRYWPPILTLLIIGAVGIVGATWRLPHSWRQSGVAPTGTGAGIRGKKSAQAAITTPPLGDLEPIYWLAMRDRRALRLARIVVFVLVPLWLLLLLASLLSLRSQKVFFIACMFTAYAAHQVVKILLASEASRRFNEDRRSGALELLLVTPVLVRDLLLGQFRALRTLFKAALAALVVMNVLMLATVVSFHGHLGMAADIQLTFVELFGGGVLLLMFDFPAYCLFGMWSGLRGQRHHQAVIRTVGCLSGITWLLLLALFVHAGNSSHDVIQTDLALWFGAGIVIDVIATVFAMGRLNDFHRTVSG